MQVLIDPWSTYSFISHALARCLELELRELGCPMIVATFLGKQVKTCMGYKDGKIVLGNSKFVVEFKLLEIQDFDIIFGMDFLSKYNCQNWLPSKNSRTTR